MPSPEQLLKDLISGDETRAENAAAMLGRLGDSVIPALEALLKSSDTDHRWWAVRTLAEMSDIGADYFIEALRDGSTEVRQAAALALAAHPAERAAPLLLQALSDEDAMVQTLAANALSAIGQPAVPILLDAFPPSSLSVKIHIMRVLAEARDVRAIPLMMKAMESGSAILQHWCEIGLQQLGLDMVYLKMS